MSQHRTHSKPLLLHSWTTHPLGPFLPRLKRRLRSRGVFLRTDAFETGDLVSLSLELHRGATDATYACLVASGLELHRSAHIALASLCNPDAAPPPRGSASLIEIQLEIRSLTPLHMALFSPTLAISA